jgi:hypothetical protein
MEWKILLIGMAALSLRIFTMDWFGWKDEGSETPKGFPQQVQSGKREQPRK